MKTYRRTLTKPGDWRDVYAAGGTTGFKWHKTYKILIVRYDKEKDKTFIRLEKI